MIRDTDVIIAEVSFPSTGLGIEIGWADTFKKPIICISKQDAKASSSLRAVSQVFIEYSTPEELIAKISKELAKIKG